MSTHTIPEESKCRNSAIFKRELLGSPADPQAQQDAHFSLSELHQPSGFQDNFMQIPGLIDSAWKKSIEIHLLNINWTD